MQTFLPYPDFEESLKCLDYRRLGKQRVEAMQILNCLAIPNRWANHPAVKMWRGFEETLKLYYNISLRIWAERGYKNIKLQRLPLGIVYSTPPFIGNQEFHASHRSNLLRKNYEYYSKFGWTEPNDLPYVWEIN